MKNSRVSFFLFALAVSLSACHEGGPPADTPTDTGPSADVGGIGDTGVPADAVSIADSGKEDTGAESEEDAGRDAGADVSWPPRAPEPPVGRELLGIAFGDGWTDPRELPSPVSTGGWEDSAYISADGTTLYFGYSRYNAEELMQGNPVIDGPDRPGQKGPAFDIYDATFPGGQWTVTNSAVNHPNPDLHEAAIGVNRDQSVMAFIRFDGSGDIYLSRKDAGEWGAPEKLPSPVNTSCAEDNAHLSPDGLTVYFDSSRADAQGSLCLDEKTNGLKRTIYRSRFAGGAWSAPDSLKGSPNATQIRWQVFVTEDEAEAYWTGIDPDCPQSCIFRAKKQADGRYAGRDVIAKAGGSGAPAGQVAGLGEVSFTADGRFMYFVFAEKTSEGKLQISVGVARK
ncbi:MAG: PD40 domain-containing protein [Deltaproteobacteria bacterium]|nr:PD40 domain-containing protein [Deltaproteobacteria bacterium]